MNLTDYQAKYITHELTKRCASDSREKLAGAVAGAQVELNTVYRRLVDTWVLYDNTGSEPNLVDWGDG